MNDTGPFGTTGRWRKSKACASNACVEVDDVSSTGTVHVRNSTRPGVTVGVDRGAWGTFIAGVRTGALTP